MTSATEKLGHKPLAPGVEGVFTYLATVYNYYIFHNPVALLTRVLFTAEICLWRERIMIGFTASSTGFKLMARRRRFPVAKAVATASFDS